MKRMFRATAALVMCLLLSGSVLWAMPGDFCYEIWQDDVRQAYDQADRCIDESGYVGRMWCRTRLAYDLIGADNAYYYCKTGYTQRWMSKVITGKEQPFLSACEIKRDITKTISSHPQS